MSPTRAWGSSGRGGSATGSRVRPITSITGATTIAWCAVRARPDSVTSVGCGASASSHTSSTV